MENKTKDLEIRATEIATGMLNLPTIYVIMSKLKCDYRINLQENKLIISDKLSNDVFIKALVKGLISMKIHIDEIVDLNKIIGLLELEKGLTSIIDDILYIENKLNKIEK